jgi:hypothetical protein
MTAPVRAAAPAPPPIGASLAGASGGAPPPLLPESAQIAGAGIDDALGLLYAAMAEQRQAGTEAGKARVQSADKDEQRALEKEEQAREREAADQASHGSGFFASIGHFLGDVANDVAHGRLDRAVEDGARDVTDAVKSPAFWNDLEQGALWVAKVAAVVGSAAATVATGGALGATVAGTALLLSVGGDAVAQTRVFGDASTTAGLVLEVAGAVGGGVAASLPSAVPAAAAGASHGLTNLAIAANGIAGGATMTAGVAHVENAGFAAAAQSASADATEARYESEQMQRLVGGVIDQMKAEDKSRQRTMQSVQGAMQANDQAAAAAAPVTVKG